MALVPRIVKIDNSILPKMYSEWWILVAIYNDCMYFHRNENIEFQEEQVEKKEMYKKMEELKRDPERWKTIETDALKLLTPEQKKSEAVKFFKDQKIREIITNL